MSGSVKDFNVILKEADWKSVDIPHDWSVKFPFDSIYEGCTGYLPTGIGWYRKQFKNTSDKEEKAYLYFDGVYNHSEYWLNGHKIGSHIYGYSPFFFDITPYLKNNNELIVKVDRSRIADSRWYSGAGIYREVKLIKENKINIPTWGTFITTPMVSEDEATVKVDYCITNNYSDTRTLDVEVAILNHESIEIQKLTQSDLKAKPGVNEYSFDLHISSPELWSVQNPALHTASITVKEKHKTQHIEETRFGIRSIRFDTENGFFLNNMNVKIKGVCIHIDAGSVGVAVPKEVWARRLKVLKDMGCNAIRVSHNPASEEFLELCDEMGFLVQDEFFDEWDYPKDKRVNRWDVHDDYESRGYADYFAKQAEQDLKNTVLAHRNHPSVFQWSIGNEIEWTYPSIRASSGFFDNMQWQGGYFFSRPPFSPERIKKEYEARSVHEIKVGETAKKLANWVREIDTTRPITANSILPSVSLVNGFADQLDVVGFSYRRVMYDYAREIYPDKCVMGTENLPQWHEWKAVEDRKHIAGVFLWTGFDHMGEVHEDWPSKASPVGLIDQAGFPKSGFHMFKSLWTDDPYIHISTHYKDSANYLEKQKGLVLDKNAPHNWYKQYWYWPARNEHWNYKQGDSVMIEVISNCESMELFLNDTSIGTKYLHQFPDRKYKWIIPYSEGTISAVGTHNNRKASAQIKTADSPYTVRATIDKSTLKKGEVAHIILHLIDDKGNEVKHTNVRLKIDLPKSLTNLGVDNGFYRNVQNYNATSIVTHKGRALMIVKAGDIIGESDIAISGIGLAETLVKVNVVE